MTLLLLQKKVFSFGYIYISSCNRWIAGSQILVFIGLLIYWFEVILKEHSKQRVKEFNISIKIILGNTLIEC